jgi:outer membrane murein-binding lipoprotein Lpp
MPRRKITMLAVAAATAAFMVAGCSNNNKTASNSTWTQQNNRTSFSRATPVQSTAYNQFAATHYVCFPQSRVFYEPQSRTWFWSEDGNWFESNNMPQVASLRWERPVVVSCDTVPFSPGCTGNRQLTTMQAKIKPVSSQRITTAHFSNDTLTRTTKPQTEASLATVNTANGFID